MIDVRDELVDELQAEVGDALRSVATYDRGDYELLYVRADIDAAYSDEERAELFKQI